MNKNTPFLSELKTLSNVNSTDLSLTILSARRRNRQLIYGCFAFLLLAGPASQTLAANLPTADDHDAHHPYYVLVESTKMPAATSEMPARCVFDKRSALTWEIKSSDNGLQSARQTYSWFEPDTRINGGFSGYSNKGRCNLQRCDTKAYITRINAMKLCGYSDWRLPSREELRTLVDYSIPYPGPAINKQFFPNTISQFYWSATANANDRETAWGIGFSFGYDYAYFKSDHGYIRLVRGPEK